jgi:hypothetical protein
MSRPTAAAALKEAETARTEIRAHEDLCAVRYEGIEKAIAALTRKQDSAVAWTIATLVTLLGGAIGMVFTLVLSHR